MPLKIDVQYSPESLNYFLELKTDNGAALQVKIPDNTNLQVVSGLLEDATNNWTLTKSHKKIYHQAYEDTNKKYIAALNDLENQKQKYAELKANHLELLGIMKKA